VGMGMVCDGRVCDRRLRTVCYLDKIIKETKRERENKVKKSEKDRGAKR